ncbi:hypothetical protein SELR_23700 [Selenomonas ruminantium subsp. lactilytica TAM6421]|uniref:Polysaccharide pyruvyl transferase domain-containing protein n=2 Tax=Selenomonas ruminantium TaxID=971 RepID=I0GTJ1_SELRL|nr:hypothetical protein SELR_23700 [Selenomonas ruminantium subsp. lactilytica TAM6421]
MEKKRVGIITLHNWFNYGSMLQSYAGQKNIEALGYECELIDFRHPRVDNNRSYKLYKPSEEDAEIAKRFRGELVRRKAAFESWLPLYNLSPRLYSSEEELKGNTDYDIYATGSDQIWNVNFRMASSAYFLAFTDSHNKVALASSIGRCKWEKLGNYAQHIEKFRQVYIREQAGADYLSEHLPHMKDRIGVMLDPTLLVSREDWEAVARESSFGECSRGDYIACYATLDEEMEHMLPMLEELHRLTGLKVALFGMMQPRFADYIENVVDVGPREWLSLIANASFVLTHSFHGTAFSLKFQRPFITYNDNLENPRKEGILKKFGLLGRIAHQANEIEEIYKTAIDFETVGKYMKVDIEESRDKLRRALDGCR